MKTIEEINQHNVNKILSEKKIPEFYPGDVVKVGVRITEGKKERIQYFEGVCIACLLYTSPSPRDRTRSRMPSSA